MKLYYLKMEGFRRHISTEIYFSDATFLIGENNVGKSSVLAALNYLLNDTKKIPKEEFFCCNENPDNNANKIVLTAEFRNLPEESKSWVGFKGRVLRYDVDENSSETGLRIIYRKTFEIDKDYVVELKEHTRTIKPCFGDCKTLRDYITAGLNEETIADKFSNVDMDKLLSKSNRKIICEIEDLYDFNEEEEIWFKNPGGIPGNVLCRMPKFLIIPAQDRTEELSGNSGTLISTLSELFSDVRDESDNYKKAQMYLNKLALELDPNDEDSEFGKMMVELNNILCDVFPQSGICAETKLSDSDKVIKPQFTVTMHSNVTTPVSLQGTGMIRSAVFALLRYKTIRDNKRIRKSGSVVRPTIIGFEEPEIYLHPNAAHQLRDTIYQLADSDINQIVCTTHSPYMIDLSQKPSQTLNNLTLDKIDIQDKGVIEGIRAYPFNTTKAFKNLQENDKTYVKMLLKIDDYISKVFFAKNVLIVEGDTEDIVLRETIKRMPDNVRKDVQSNWQIIKARGKAAIISLVKYLKCMGIEPMVIHDEDDEVENAKKFNQPILDALNNPKNRFMLHNCIEDVLGYKAPSNEKPYHAFKYVNDNWGNDWESICNEKWKELMEKIFEQSFEHIKKETLNMVASDTEE